MAFAMYFPFPHGKRLKSIDEHGKEEYATVDHWQHVAEAAQVADTSPDPGASTAEADQTDEELPPNPADAIEKLYTARGELDVIIDLIRNVEENQFLTVSNVPKPKPKNFLAEYTADERLRLGRKQAALKAAATRLQAGFAAAQEIRAQGNKFFTDLSRLQRFWKVRLNASSGAVAFRVDLSLGPAVAKLSAFPPGDALVDVLEDEDGSLRVQLEDKAAPGSPRVCVGAWGVHQLLKQRQQELMWLAIRAHLQQEAAANPTNAFMFNLANMVVRRLRSATQEPELLSLRALLLHHFWFYFVGGHNQPAAPLPRGLLEDLNDWLFFQAFRQNVLWQLDLQAVHFPGVVLASLPSWQQQTGVIQVELQPGQHVLLIVRQNYLEVEGVISRVPGTRWTRDTVTRASEDEVEWLLSHLVERLQPQVVQQAKRRRVSGLSVEAEPTQGQSVHGGDGDGAQRPMGGESVVLQLDAAGLLVAELS